MVKRIVNLSNLTLLTALILSGIAAWYSILGLMAIFSAAVIPIIVMGGSLEVAKVVTTVWMHKYWNKINWTFKVYLVPAVISLAFLTSMGIFGFLSKAHSDQSLVSGDVQSKIAVYDEKIKTEKENIEANRKALKQMDEGVDQVLGRSTTETGADKAVALRKSQQKERIRLQNEISQSQKLISELNDARAPIAAEVRKVDAEVGPIKYIAALIYGDNPDNNLLERAVRWVIILIVFVFDPLALTLVIASNTSRKWDKEESEKENKPDAWVADVGEKPTQAEINEYEQDDTKPIDEKLSEDLPTPDDSTSKEEKQLLANLTVDEHPYLFAPPGDPHPPGVEPCPPMVYKPEEPKPIENTVVESPVENSTPEEKISINFDMTADTNSPAIETEGVTKEYPIREIDNEYVSYEGKTIRKDALKEIKPEFFRLTSENADQPNAIFGNSFPKVAKKGETFVRIDTIPNKVFKFDGLKWIEVVKSLSDSYLDNKEYIQFLISKIQTGEYDIDTLSDIERDKIALFLNTQDTNPAT